MNKILRGAKPSEAPVQQPAQFELVINLKTGNVAIMEKPEARDYHEKGEAHEYTSGSGTLPSAEK